MTEWFTRALLFVKQGRYKEAEPFLRDAIKEDPLDPQGYFFLAICLLHDSQRSREALSMIDEALRLHPGRGSYHAQRANILVILGRSKEAMNEIAEARRLEPRSADSHLSESVAMLVQGKPVEAEEAARRALALDADNEAAADNLADALRLQGKLVESHEQIQNLLARNPENPWTHSSAGMLALQKDDVRLAETHFLEALRIDPEHPEAREGLLHAFRARSALYRAYLKYSFAMERLSRRNRWFLVIGLLLIMQVSKYAFSGTLAPIGYLVAALYLLFILWIWVAKGVGNLFLLFDRFASHALRREEKLEAVVVGGGVLLGLALFVIGLPLKQVSPIVIGLILISAAFPMSLVFTNRSKLGRRVFGLMGSAVYLGGLLALFFLFAPIQNGANLALIAFGASLVLSLATTWIGNIPALRRA